jgi:DNA (cytosine-5)-methyltransferase 1
MKTLIAVDLFCGAGGATEALLRACKRKGYKLDMVGINHWDLAIATHSKNHTYAQHLCADINEVNPMSVHPGKRIHVILAGIECIFFSAARGGKPVNDQRRSTGWKVLEWIEKRNPDTVIIENVPAFMKWGPLYLSGPNKDKPIKSEQGKIFLAFINAMEAFGYSVEYRVMTAADYGDPTTRQRFFLVARKRNTGRPHWPEPSHSKEGGTDMFGKRLKKWVPVKEIIDWQDKGESIFNRKKPLCDNTMRRIFEGLKKYSKINLEPFILVNRGGDDGYLRSSPINDPVGAMTTSPAMGIVEPFLIPRRMTDGPVADSIRAPIRTILAGDSTGVVQPFLVELYGTSNAASIDQPMPVATASGGHHALAQPFLLPMEHTTGSHRSSPTSEPINTVTAKGDFGLVEPMVMSLEHPGHRRAFSVNETMPTMTTANAWAVAEPFLTEYHNGNGGKKRSRSVKSPAPTLDTSNRMGLVQPFLVQYNGTGGAESADDPLNAITAKARWGLVVVIQDKQYILDIRYRMLRPKELKRAHSFSEDYEFLGSQEDQIRMIGNSWPVKMAEAICYENI